MIRQMTLGIAGTAKNTGKTTATIEMLDIIRARGAVLGVTSIGYDGETVDNITGLPKPRVLLKKGDLVAVSERCLPVSSAKVRVWERMDIAAPLGRIVCGEVIREGLLVLAGPNQSRHLEEVKNWMYRHSANVLLVDGALNRIAPIVETDGFIMSTGASYSTDIDRLSRETHSVEVVCNQPDVFDGVLPDHLKERTVVTGQDGEVRAHYPANLFDPAEIAGIEKHLVKSAVFFCPGIISYRCLEFLGEITFAAGTTFVFDNPVKLMLCGSVPAAQRFIEVIGDKMGRVCYRRAVPLLAVTVNPFYPAYRYETHDYQPCYIDKQELLSSVRSSVEVPVFDVVWEGSVGLTSLLAEKICG